MSRKDKKIGYWRCLLTTGHKEITKFSEERENGYIQDYATTECQCGKYSYKMPVGDNVTLS